MATMNHAGEEAYPTDLRDAMYSEANMLGSVKPKGTDDTATATTSGSVHGGSRSSQTLERSTEGRFISTNDGVSAEKNHVVAQNEGLEKLGAYVLNDENEHPGDDAYSKITQDEEFSLHLSRPTGTGSQQLELWIREVNRVVRVPPLNIHTAASPRSRMALSPTARTGQPAFSPSNKNGYVSPSKRNILSGSPLKGRRPRSVLAEDIHPEDPRFHQVTPKVQNSQVIMASIENKYKNLRENLIQDPTIDAPVSSDRDDDDSRSECESPRRRPQNETAPVHNRGSRGHASTGRNTSRNDFAVRDHFSLGLLSTRSSGILSENSWSSLDSQSERSGISFPGKDAASFCASKTFNLHYGKHLQ